MNKIPLDSHGYAPFLDSAIPDQMIRESMVGDIGTTTQIA